MSPVHSTPSDPAAPLPQPRSKTDLFLSFTAMALQGFGGVVAVVQRELVERKRWLTPEQFAEDWAVAQIMPGPNVVNLAMMVGGRAFGLGGALAALAGMLVVPMAIAILVAVLFTGVADSPQAQGALRGMGAVVAGLIAATGLKLLPALRHNVMGWHVCAALAAATFVGVALLRWPLPWVLPVLGLTGFAWAWRQLARAGGKSADAAVERQP
jgi:chromate transporter